MKVNKKIIIGIILLVIILVITILIVVLANQNKESSIIEEEEEEYFQSKLVSISDELKEKKNYKIRLKFNDENERVISRYESITKVEVLDEGKKDIYVISSKNKTTYLLDENTKQYYEYNNNTALQNDFIDNIDTVLKKNFNTGKENINGKDYRYEEFAKTSAFIINYKSNINNTQTKTRVYFEGNNIKYIKTYVGDVEQLLTVEIEIGNQTKDDFTSSIKGYTKAN